MKSQAQRQTGVYVPDWMVIPMVFWSAAFYQSYAAFAAMMVARQTVPVRKDKN